MLRFCARFCALLALGFAIGIGYLSIQEHPMGIVFKTVFTVQGYVKGATPTPPVKDMKPLPRPSGEIHLDLQGSASKMPANGLGMCCRPTAYDPVSVERTVLWYLLQGGRHIDTASVYLNHVAIGKAIQEAVSLGIPRAEIFLVTKIFMDDFGYHETLNKYQKMLADLQLEYTDLVLIHMPIKASPTLFLNYYWKKLVGGADMSVDTVSSQPEQVQFRAETWRALSELRAKGLIKNVGVSNFNIKLLQEIENLKLAPIAANQVQYHPWAPEWMREVVKYCQEKNIVVTAYFSLGGTENKQKTFELDILNKMASAHKKRPAQVLLRWALQKGIAVIPGTGNPNHMIDNLETYAFRLSEDDMAVLDGMSSLPVKDNFVFFDF